MINYTIFNQSTVVSTQNLQNMVKAINIYLITFCNDWGLAPIQLVISTSSVHPNNSIYMLDDTDSPGALGYHDEINGKSYAKIFARTILGYGGVILYKDSHTFTVAQVLSHELLEMIGNSEVSKWYLDNNGTLWAGELCDAVESNIILYTLPGNIKVGLSDYVLPSWFSPDTTTRPFNKLNTIQTPFELDFGGYSIIIEITSGYIDTIYGSAHISGTSSLVSINAANIAKDVTEISKKFGLKIKPKS